MATIRRRSWTTALGETRESWQVDFTDQHGKRRHRQFARKKDADRWLLEARQQVERGVFSADSASSTIAEACQLWLERCGRDNLERATMTQYRSHVTHHIAPLLETVKLSRLSGRQWRSSSTSCWTPGAHGRWPRRSRLARVGDRRGATPRDGRTERRRRRQGDDAKAAQAQSHHPIEGTGSDGAGACAGRERAALVLVVFSGMRASEIRGLRWCDVDFGGQLIRVRQRADTSGNIGSLKSASSRRDLPMPPTLANTLREWKLASGGVGELVFPGRDGRPLRTTRCATCSGACTPIATSTRHG